MLPDGGVAEQISEYVLERFPLARQRGLHPSDRLLETGIIDSMGILEVVEFLERVFNITVVDEDLLPENFQTIKDLAAFVEAKMNGVSH